MHTSRSTLLLLLPPALLGHVIMLVLEVGVKGAGLSGVLAVLLVFVEGVVLSPALVSTYIFPHDDVWCMKY